MDGAQGGGGAASSIQVPHFRYHSLNKTSLWLCRAHTNQQGALLKKSNSGADKYIYYVAPI